MAASAASVRRVAGRHRLRRLTAVPPPSVVLAACGGTLPAADVAGRPEDVLEEEVGVRPDVSCPEDGTA